VTVVERLTVDVNIVRDDRAQELFALARRGDVELAIAPQGYRLDVRGELAEQLDAVLRSNNVAEARQLAYPSEVTFPGPNLLPGAVVPDFRNAWEAVLATWNGPGSQADDRDALHVETHVHEKRDVLITEDRGMRTMCRRLREEHEIDVVAMSLEDYLERQRPV
jgi:hypothetical protein